MPPISACDRAATAELGGDERAGDARRRAAGSKASARSSPATSRSATSGREHRARLARAQCRSSSCRSGSGRVAVIVVIGCRRVRTDRIGGVQSRIWTTPLDLDSGTVVTCEGRVWTWTTRGLRPVLPDLASARRARRALVAADRPRHAGRHDPVQRPRAWPARPVAEPAHASACASLERAGLVEPGRRRVPPHRLGPRARADRVRPRGSGVPSGRSASRTRTKLDAELLVWWMHTGLDTSTLPGDRHVLPRALQRRQAAVLDRHAIRPGTRCALSDPGFEVDLTVRSDLSTLYQVWLGRLPLAAAAADAVG